MGGCVSEKMDLVEALKTLGWGVRSDLTPNVVKQAAIVLEKECAKLTKSIVLKYCDYLGDSFVSPEDISQKVMVVFLDRTTPLPGAPPSSPQLAKGYLIRTIKNEMKSIIRKNESEKTTSMYFLNEEGDFEELQFPANESRLDLEFPSLCDDWRKGLESILDYIEESVLESEEIKEEYIEEFRTYWPRIRCAVIESAKSLRSESFRYQHYEVFWRCVACALDYTTMEAEVRRSFERQSVPVPDHISDEYKKERNRLDQQNSRTMRRIFEAMMKAGVDKEIAMRFIQALSPRGPKSQGAETEMSEKEHDEFS